MKNYYFLLMILLSIISSGQRPFIIEVESDENGNLSLPIFSGTQIYIYTLKETEDPSIIIKDALLSSSPTLTIEDLVANTAYDLEILNFTEPSIDYTFPLRIKLGRTQAKKLKQWGDVTWSNDMSKFASGTLYYNYSDFKIEATDIPNFSNVTNMESMFELTILSNIPNINNWDVSNVTNMKTMFRWSEFNQEISDWDVSNVTNMNNMFCDSPFNQEIKTMIDEDGKKKWDVSNVEDMGYMLANSPFNRDISNWNVSKVKDMSYMFNASKFNRDISTWYVSNVTNMKHMFSYSPFNQDISDWNVSNVTDMSLMFSGTQFIQEISNWNVSNVTNMSNMFSDSQFNQPIDNWDVSNVINMSFMFSNAQFNQPISNWDVSSVTNMERMFRNAQFNQPIGNWDVSNVTNMDRIFNMSQFNQSLGGWIFGTPGLIVDLYGSKIDCENLSTTINGWYDNENIRFIENKLNAQGLRYNRTALEAYNKLFNIGGNQTNPGVWSIEPYVNIDNPDPNRNAPEYLEFCGLEPNGNPFIIEVVSDQNGDLILPIFNGTPRYIYRLKQLNMPGIEVRPTTSSVASTLTIDGLNTNTAYDLEILNDTDANGEIPLRIKLGNYAKKIKQWGSILWNEDMSSFAEGAVDLIVVADEIVTNINNIQETIPDMPELAHVTDFSNMFKSTGINVPQTELNTIFSDGKWKINHIGDWEIQSVKNMSYMFANSAFDADLDEWEIIGRVTDFSHMFEASKFNSEPFQYYVNNLDLLYSSTMSSIFKDSPFNQLLNYWDISAVTDMSFMFAGTSLFNQPLNNWNLFAVTNANQIFANGLFNQNLGSWTFGDQSFVLDLDGSAIDCNNMSLSLIGWDNSSNDKTITLKADTRSYNQSAYEAYRNLFLEAGHSWNLENNLGPIYDENCGIAYCLKPKAAGSIISSLPKMIINTLKSGDNSPAEQMSDSFNGFVSLTKGFVLSHVAKSEDIINPIEGMLIYEVEDACIKMYSPNGNNLEWNCISRTCNDSF